MMNLVFRIAAFGALFALAACESTLHYSPREEMRQQRALEEMPGVDGARDAVMRFDTNKDGTVTRDEMNAVLAADFIGADHDGDKRLNSEETRAANERRWEADASSSTPLIDWNQDGYVSMDEFVNSSRASFERFDRDGDGAVTENEFNQMRPRGPRDDWRSWGHGQGG